jgi:2-polyprenyl-6-hydroxyphenyl methylase/3-demethylubiquinone-9 3-methyltransferase
LARSAFTFGDNWLKFSSLLDEARVRTATTSIQRLLARDRLDGLSFLDVGAGSGLFSIAALNLGAERVVAVDRDENCLRAIRENVRRFVAPAFVSRLDARQGDVLDVTSLPTEQFDVVYAWGSLHHTGAMWEAILNASARTRDDGLFALAIYNHTWSSPGWHLLKRLYHSSPVFVRTGMVAFLTGIRATVRALMGKSPFRSERGMSVWFDAVDWLGGLPYEYATSARIEAFLDECGFTTVHRVLTTRSGCNEFVCSRLASKN